MIIKYKWKKPWYLCYPKEQFWAYYDSGSRTYFCFAEFGRKEYQGASAHSFENAYNRLSMEVKVPSIDRFVLHTPQTLRINGVDLLHLE